MKVKAKIMGIEAGLNDEDHLDLSFVGISKQHFGGNDREIAMSLRVQVPRALVRDYTIGDSYEITLERSKPE